MVFQTTTGRSYFNPLNKNSNLKLSIIIPIFNEMGFIARVIEQIKDVTLPAGMTKEIIIIDDGSTDETSRALNGYAKDPMLKIYRLEKNSGKSNAVRIGIEKSQGDILLIQDADLEYSPCHYPALLRPILEENASAVYGSRFKGRIKGMALINRIANAISNLTLNLIYSAKITDVNTGYKVFRREIFEKIKIESSYFMLETEITCKLLGSGYKISEIPIEYTARSRKEGKKMSHAKALLMYWGIFKYSFGV